MLLRQVERVSDDHALPQRTKHILSQLVRESSTVGGEREAEDVVQGDGGRLDFGSETLEGGEVGPEVEGSDIAVGHVEVLAMGEREPSG